MSELFDKQVNVQKDSYFWGSCKLLQAHEWKWMKKHKNVFDRRKYFLRCMQKTDENDLNELGVKNFWHNEGMYYVRMYVGICLVNEWIGIKEMVLQAWAHKRVP